MRLSERLPGCWLDPCEPDPEHVDRRRPKMGLMFDSELLALRSGSEAPKKKVESPFPPPRDGGLLRVTRSCEAVSPASSSESK